MIKITCKDFGTLSTYIFALCSYENLFVVHLVYHMRWLCALAVALGAIRGKEVFKAIWSFISYLGIPSTHISSVRILQKKNDKVLQPLRCY